MDLTGRKREETSRCGLFEIPLKIIARCGIIRVSGSILHHTERTVIVMGFDPQKEMDALFAGYQEEFEDAIEAVDITDDFMFAHVMQDKTICIELLQNLLPGQKIRDVKYYRVDGDSPEETYPDTQMTISPEYDRRGIRLDAYLDDGKTVYNIEMQTTRQIALPRRARTYQAYLDSHQLMRGTNFDKLKESYVIFICKFDPFGMGWSRYSFSSRCDDDPSLLLNDGAYKLFFNTRGSGDGISQSLREVLTYMNNTKSYPVKETENSLIRRIERAVRTAKQNDDWRRNFMTYQVRYRSAVLEGEQRGIEIGQQRGIEQKARETALLLQRLGKLSTQEIAAAVGYDLATVSAWLSPAAGQVHPV